MKHKTFGLITPCDNCPFRKDITPYLRPERIRQMKRDLVDNDMSFHCHKSTTLTDADEPYTYTGKEMHCAGSLILLEKIERPNQLMRIGERLRVYNRHALKGVDIVFNSFEEMEAAQTK